MLRAARSARPPRRPRLPAAFAAILVAIGMLARFAHADDLVRDDKSGLQYLEVMTGGADLADHVPIIVAMHGLGDHPESFRIILDDLPARARVVFPRAPTPHGPDGFSWFDFHADDDEGTAALGEGVRSAGERVATLLAGLIKERGGPERAIVCGFSQGGILSFDLAAAHPELIAEAIPISGYLPSPLWPPERPKVRPLPKILALHGADDHLIPLQWANWSIEALRSNGYDVTLKSWPGVAHAISPEMHSALIAAVDTAVTDLSEHAAEHHASGGEGHEAADDAAAHKPGSVEVPGPPPANSPPASPMPPNVSAP